MTPTNAIASSSGVLGDARRGDELERNGVREYAAALCLSPSLRNGVTCSTAARSKSTGERIFIRAPAPHKH